MQGPRHHRFVRAALKLSVVLVALLALGGCREDRDSDRSAAQYQRRLDSSGKRVLIVGADGQPVAKLRKRIQKYKVYDAQLTPVGFVSWTPSKKDGGSQATVVAKSIDRDDAEAIEQVSEGNYELDARLRIERTDGGWAIFGPTAELVGVFERDDEDNWRLRRSYEDGAVIEAKTTDSGVALVRDGKAILETQTGDLSALELLAVELDGLSMLHRMTVGVWMEHARP